MREGEHNQTQIPVRIKLADGAQMPYLGSPFSAGYDIYAFEAVDAAGIYIIISYHVS